MNKNINQKLLGNQETLVQCAELSLACKHLKKYINIFQRFEAPNQANFMQQIALFQRAEKIKSVHLDSKKSHTL